MEMVDETEGACDCELARLLDGFEPLLVPALSEPVDGTLTDDPLLSAFEGLLPSWDAASPLDLVPSPADRASPSWQDTVQAKPEPDCALGLPIESLSPQPPPAALSAGPAPGELGLLRLRPAASRASSPGSAGALSPPAGATEGARLRSVAVQGAGDAAAVQCAQRPAALSVRCPQLCAAGEQSPQGDCHHRSPFALLRRYYELKEQDEKEAAQQLKHGRATQEQLEQGPEAAMPLGPPAAGPSASMMTVAKVGGLLPLAVQPPAKRLSLNLAGASSLLTSSLTLPATPAALHSKPVAVVLCCYESAAEGVQGKAAGEPKAKRHRIEDRVQDLSLENEALREEIRRARRTLQAWAQQGYVTSDQALEYLISAPAP